jgi:hypothetical protein
MPNTEAEAKLLQLSSLLTPENQAELLACVRLAYAAETSARKSPGNADTEGDLPQECSCGDTRHKK